MTVFYDAANNVTNYAIDTQTMSLADNINKNPIVTATTTDTAAIITAIYANSNSKWVL